MTSIRQTLHENAFLAAALALPVVVGVFFVAATAIPRWTVAPPAYDLIVKVTRPYDAAPASIGVDYAVRDNRVIAVASRPTPRQVVQRWALLTVDHVTLEAREIAVVLPDSLDQGEAERGVPVSALAAVRVSPETTAPDGYTLRSRTRGGPGLVGELFGMRSDRQGAALVKGGRAVTVRLPEPFREPYQTVASVGWIVPGGR